VIETQIKSGEFSNEGETKRNQPSKDYWLGRLPFYRWDICV